MHSIADNARKQRIADLSVATGKSAEVGLDQRHLFRGNESMHVLDNPIWSAVNSFQTGISTGNRLARRFLRELSPLCGVVDPTDETCLDALASIVVANEGVGVFSTVPVKFNPLWNVVWQYEFDQMICTSATYREVATRPAPQQMRELGMVDGPGMVGLANVAQPGPMELQTVAMGRYFGIFNSEGALVSMAGERLRLDGYVELSAVCTHPSFRGRGYAEHVTAHVTEGILQRGAEAFLHVKSNNRAAIAMYQRLGFNTRRKMYITSLCRTGLGSGIYEG